MHLLHLNANTKVHLICHYCKDKNGIPDKEILSIHEVIEANEASFFKTYPILEDN